MNIKLILFEKYILFSTSTNRWEILKSHLQPHQLIVKQLSDTWWSARADDVSALQAAYREVRKVLVTLSECETENSLAKTETKSLTKMFNK